MRQAAYNDRETETQFRQALDVGKHGEAAGCGSDFEKEKQGIQRQVLGTRGILNLVTLKKTSTLRQFLKVGFFGFFIFVIQHCFICRPSDSTVSDDDGIEPRTVATLALIARRSTLSKNVNNFPVPSRDVTNGDYTLAGNILIIPRQTEFG